MPFSGEQRQPNAQLSDCFADDHMWSYCRQSRQVTCPMCNLVIKLEVSFSLGRAWSRSPAPMVPTPQAAQPAAPGMSPLLPVLVVCSAHDMSRLLHILDLMHTFMYCKQVACQVLS